MTIAMRMNSKSVSTPHAEPEPASAEGPALDQMLAQTLHAKHDFWIQTHPSSSNGSNEGVYLSTFQKGRGQHLTTLTPDQARILGWRLIGLAGQVEASQAV